MSPLPMVSLVLPVRNEGAFIVRSLRSVLTQDYPPDRLEVIVADGDSDDQTPAVVRDFMRRHPNLRLIDNPERIVATGLNRAVAEARGDVIVRVDGHCEIAPDYVRRCVEHLMAGFDGVGGAVQTIGETPRAAAIAAAMSSPFGVGNSAFRTTTGRSMLADTVPFPAYTRALVESAGPVDTELVRNQDDEYNYRLRKMGRRLLLAGDVRSRYYSRSSLGSLWRQYRQYGYWKVRVLQKHPRQMRARQFVPPLFVAALLVLAAASPFLVPAAAMLAALVSTYAVANAAATWITSRGEDITRPWIVSVAFATLHVAYGVGFLLGLVRFWNRWRGGDGPRQHAAAGRDTPPTADGQRARRAFDVATALAALLAFAVPLVVIALLVRISSPGPVIYRQRRVGKGGQPFTLYKFRTMRAGSTGASITAGDRDSRIYPMGRWLRRWKLDELPQFWNVLRGDMSIIGPRPELECFVQRYTTAQRRILADRPGLASVSVLAYPDEGDLLQAAADPEAMYETELLPRKLAMDMRYEQERSVGSDLALLGRMAWFVAVGNRRLRHARPSSTREGGGRVRA